MPHTRAHVIVATIILVVAIACIAIGVMRAEHVVVFQKASSICLECIGIA